MILELIQEAVQSGARLKSAAGMLGLSSRTVIRWRREGGGEDRRRGPRSSPSQALSAEERKQVLDIATSPAFRDLSPKQIVPRLADQGVYLASESSFYRLLRERRMMTHRQSSKPPVCHRPKEQVATGPCQVWSWDISVLQQRERRVEMT